MFLYIDPLKQGLKLIMGYKNKKDILNVFIHRSIKTRIETRKSCQYKSYTSKFLYIDPLKQGLKLNRIVIIYIF